MDDKEFMEKVEELQRKFKDETDILLKQYREEVNKIAKSIESRRLSQLRKDLNS